MPKLRTTITALAALAVLAVPAAASAKARDRDHDGMPDRWERLHHLSTARNDASRDPDRDGLRNIAEYRAHTDPRDADTDNDGVNDANEDADRDGVDNGNEDREGTNPRSRDSNGNGRPDGQEDRDRDHLANAAEDRTGNDPKDPDTDDDGVKDGAEQAGTIASFDAKTGALSITLANGTTVSGTVNASTEIKCESEGDHERGHGGHGASRHDGSGSAEDTPGSGQGSKGDDDTPGTSGDKPESDDDGEGQCTAADLVAGTAVHQAEIVVTPAGSIFHEIELVKAPPATPAPAAAPGA